MSSVLWRLHSTHLLSLAWHTFQLLVDDENFKRQPFGGSWRKKFGGWRTVAKKSPRLLRPRWLKWHKTRRCVITIQLGHPLLKPTFKIITEEMFLLHSTQAALFQCLHFLRTSQQNWLQHLMLRWLSSLFAKPQSVNSTELNSSGHNFPLC